MTMTNNSKGTNLFGTVKYFYEKPLGLIISLYVCGFVATNSFLSGYRYLATDIFDKNYIIVGMHCMLFLAIVFIVIGQGWEEINQNFNARLPYLKTRSKFYFF